MEDRYFVEPDTKFVKEVIDLGGKSLKKCFQCGTCSVVCSLSPVEKPFPRKEMIWAQWGLKDRLLKGPDIWLCHQCTDCSTHCPRDAKPGDVLAAIRSYSVLHLTLPGFLTRAFQAPKYLLAILALPALLLFAFLWATGNLTFPEGEISFEHFIPNTYAYIGMGAIVVYLLIVVGIGISRFWKNINEFGTNLEPIGSGGGNSPGKFSSVLVDILKHSKFGKCEVNKVSRYTHMGILYGAILLLIATGLSAILHHFVGIYSPHSLISPVKIAGNLGAVLLLAGCILVIFRRLSANNSNIGRTVYFDWFLILMLFFTTVSGIATEVIRIAELATASYWTYLVHLWLMFALFIYAPFSKGAHLVYRTLAMVYAKQIGREVE
jgi:quinone-modifying oxidoreductase subunit QmoC